MIKNKNKENEMNKVYMVVSTDVYEPGYTGIYATEEAAWAFIDSTVAHYEDDPSQETYGGRQWYTVIEEEVFG